MKSVWSSLSKDGEPGSIAADFGCGTQARNPLGCETLIGVDILDPSFIAFPEQSFDYVKVEHGQYPDLPRNSLDVIYAYDFLEHLSREPKRGDSPNDFIAMMNVIWDSLKPGGVLLAVTPAYPSPAAFLDPTHVNVITDRTHLYFSDHAWARTNGYGFYGQFRTVVVSWVSTENNPELWERFPTDSSPRHLALPKSLRRYLGKAETKTHLLWVLEKTDLPVAQSC
jgi:SAM-dependent methyltransferase